MHAASQPELEIFKILKGIKVVFDVGARTDIDYLMMRPSIELHLFEPDKFFTEGLENELKRVGKVARVNKYGLGNEIGDFHYDPGSQSFMKIDGEFVYPVKTLNWYVKENGITKIDLLKIDTEGWDYKVLLGGSEILPNTKYIQYEHWDKPDIFRDLLEKDFDMEYIGYRNVFCMNKKLVSKKTRSKIIKFIRDNQFGKLA